MADHDPSHDDQIPDGEAEEIVEPDNSTVDDWFGQNVARDQEVADEIAAEDGTGEKAEERFREEAEGEETYRDGHPEPDPEHARGRTGE